jgi:thioredoxin-related protein
MKKILLIILSLNYFSNCYAQINWVNDLNTAKALAISNDKLILMDFTATWCRPCKEMTKYLWESKEMEKYKDNFIFYQSDIDVEQSLARQFRVSSIPNVVIIAVNDDLIGQKAGFSYSFEHLNFMNAFPAKLNGLNNALSTFTNIEKADDDNFMAGVGYQALAFQTISPSVKQDFLIFSEGYYKKYIKTTKEDTKRAELLSFLNQANMNKAAKVIAKINGFSENYFGEDLQELRNLVLAVSYKKEGDEIKSGELKEKIKDEFLLSLLK